MELSGGYRFHNKAGERTAVLDKDGKLTLVDEAGSIEIWENWRYYVKEVTGARPVRGEESEILDQLGATLGFYQQIPTLVHKSRWANPNGDLQGKEENMTSTATATKKAVTPAKALAKAAPKANGKGKAEVALNDCVCGCGKKTKKTFFPGHDSTVHSWERKIAKGEMKIGSLAPSAQKYIRAHGHA